MSRARPKETKQQVCQSMSGFFSVSKSRALNNEGASKSAGKRGILSIPHLQPLLHCTLEIYHDAWYITTSSLRSMSGAVRARGPMRVDSFPLFQIMVKIMPVQGIRAAHSLTARHRAGVWKIDRGTECMGRMFLLGSSHIHGLRIML